MKHCYKCKEFKPLDMFYTDNSRKDKKGHICKPCCKNTISAYNKANPDKKKEVSKKYRDNNVDKCRESSRLSASKNKELGKQWVKNNIDKVRIYKSNNRAKRKNSIGTHTPHEIDNLFNKQQGKCACCYESIINGYHKDHIVPLAKQGTNDIYNIQLLCKLCNLRKSSRDPIKFMQSMGYLL